MKTTSTVFGSLARRTLAALVVLGLFAPASAQSTSTLDAKFEASKEGPQVLRARGVAKKLPDQTRLMLKFFVKGVPDTANYFELGVEKEAFDTVVGLEGRQPAPIVYRVELWLMIGKQTPAVKKKLQRDLGVSENHNEVLDAQDLAVGSEEERKKFQIESIRCFQTVIRDVLVQVEKLEAAVEKNVTEKDFAKEKGEIKAALRALQNRYNDLIKKFYNIGEMDALNACRSLVATAFDALAVVVSKPVDTRSKCDYVRGQSDKLKLDLEAKLRGLGVPVELPPEKPAGDAPPPGPKKE